MEFNSVPLAARASGFIGSWAGVERVIQASSVQFQFEPPAGAHKGSEMLGECFFEAMVRMGMPAAAAIASATVPQGPGDASPAPKGGIALEAARGFSAALSFDDAGPLCETRRVR